MSSSSYLSHFADGKTERPSEETWFGFVQCPRVSEEWPVEPQPRALPLLNLHPEPCGGFEANHPYEGILRAGEIGLNYRET